MASIIDSPPQDTLEAQFRNTEAARLYALIERIKVGLMRLRGNNAATDSLRMNYTALLGQAYGLLGQDANSDGIAQIEGVIASLESKFDDCVHTADAIALQSLLSGDKEVIPLSLEELDKICNVDFPLMTNDLQLLQASNLQINRDLREMRRGHEQFTNIMYMVTILSDDTLSGEVKERKVKKIKDEAEADIEAEVKKEDTAMENAGVPEEERAVQRQHFRAFMHARVNYMHEAAQNIAGKMKTSYTAAKPEIAEAYAHLVRNPAIRLKNDCIVYEKQAQAFAGRNAIAARTMGGELMSSSAARMHDLAADMTIRTEHFHDRIRTAHDIHSIKRITEEEALGLNETLKVMLEQNEMDAGWISGNLLTLAEPAKLHEDIAQAAEFLCINESLLVAYINESRKANRIFFHIGREKQSWCQQEEKRRMACSSPHL